MAEPEDPQLRHATVATLLRGVASRHPTREALVADGARFSYAQMDTRTDRVAEGLRRRGIGPDDVIATLLLDGVAMIELLCAAAKLGATLLAINWRLSPAEIAYILHDGRPVLCFVSVCFAPVARAADPQRAFVVIGDEDPDGLLAPLGIDADTPRMAPVAISPGRRWYMLYTSGTTGRPKGCQHSQGGYYLRALSEMGWSGLRETDRCLLAAPLFHVSGLGNLVNWFAAGACVVVAPRHQTADALLRLVHAEKISVQTFPMAQIADYLRLQAASRLPLSLRLVIGGGGMTPLPLLHAIRDTLGADMILGYGQSEVGGFACALRLGDQLDRPTACGKLLPHLEARLVDEAGHDVGDGAHGELLLRGPAVTLGYHNRPDDTAEAMEEGWLRTGDLFWRDADGFFHFAGRRKELIKTGGENVYPAEVEQVLSTHPAVDDVCVVGVPDPKWHEAIKAFIVLKAGERPDPADLLTHCRHSIAGYKRPRFIEFVDAIPRNFQGKPQRFALSARPVDASQSTDLAQRGMTGGGEEG